MRGDREFLREFIRGAAAGAAAGLAAMAAMYVVSALVGIRTLPALLSEPLLAALPGPVFGFLIDRLQHAGKVLEELGLVLLVVLLLAALGGAAGALRARTTLGHLPLAAALLAWAAVLLIALPAGGAGMLGLADGLATPVTWGVVFTVYALVLEMGLGPAGQAAAPTDPGRRRLLGAAPAAIAALSLGVIGVRLVPAWLQSLSPAGAGTGGPAADLTPVRDFYVVSKNFNDPVVDGGRWALSVHGLAGSPYRISLTEFRALPPVTLLATLECISNNVGGDQVSTGEFRGVRLANLLGRAQPLPQARFVNLRSRDGYVESLPLDLVLSDPDVLVAHTLGGADLPPAHGFPARVLVPGRYGMKGPKWLEDIELASSEATGYWEGQGWDQAAVVKTMSRIDAPLEGAIVGAGRVEVAGIAFAGTRGISGVEVSADGGRTWAAAGLRPPLSPLTWTLWSYEWPAAAGEHTLSVRATDGRGALQDAAVAPSFPSGSSGYHRVRVSVSR